MKTACCLPVNKKKTMGHFISVFRFDLINANINDEFYNKLKKDQIPDVVSNERKQSCIFFKIINIVLRLLLKKFSTSKRVGVNVIGN